MDCIHRSLQGRVRTQDVRAAVAAGLVQIQFPKARIGRGTYCRPVFLRIHCGPPDFGDYSHPHHRSGTVHRKMGI